MSRGLSKEESIRLILNAIINKIIDNIDDDNLKEELLSYINNQL